MTGTVEVRQPTSHSLSDFMASPFIRRLVTWHQRTFALCQQARTVVGRRAAATARGCQEPAGNFGAREVEIVSESNSIAESDGIER
jgi:hypothetical protein